MDAWLYVSSRGPCSALSMPRYAGAGCRLRRLFEDVPPSLLPKPVKPVLLTDQQARLNYRFVNDEVEGGDSVELLHRVRKGLKPVGTLLIKRQEMRFATDRAIVGASRGFGLRFIIVTAKGGRRVAGVFQEGVTLSNYYDPDAVIARYAEVGVTLDPVIFTTEMRGLVRAVITDNLSEELRLPITGLCLGYPIEETLKCMGKLER